MSIGCYAQQMKHWTLHKNVQCTIFWLAEHNLKTKGKKVWCQNGKKENFFFILIYVDPYKCLFYYSNVFK